MDSYREHPGEYDAAESAAAPQPDVPNAIGTDERRMHVRAYNYWCTLLDGRDFPSIHDLEATAIEDFSSHSVLLNFTDAINDPATSFVGDAIRAEIGVEKIQRISDVPGRSLLSRLTDHHFQIIATRAPVGFEAEFVNQRGHEISYRGILMPFSSDGQDIDYVYGVINWKDNGPASEARMPLRAVFPPIVAEREDEQEILDKLAAEERAYEERIGLRDKALASMPVVPQLGPQEDLPVAAHHLSWEDGPLADPVADEEPAISLDDDAGLADRLAVARESAEVCKAADGRSRGALYRALAMAYDFAVAARRVPEDYAEILEDAGVKGQARAPMTPVVKLVFGVDYDKTRLTEFAAALSNAEREGVDFGGFEAFLGAADGGLKGLVAAERKARRPDRRQEDRVELGKTALRAAPPIALAELATNEEFALVLTRRNANGVHEVVELVADAALLERALRRAAR
ncbi:MAG: hypothetical protein M3Q57_00045 [Pseudomonadota bacterium]|nr:hypothetical protein [Pseudomonadota bacterium]